MSALSLALKNDSRDKPSPATTTPVPSSSSSSSSPNHIHIAQKPPSSMLSPPLSFSPSSYSASNRSSLVLSHDLPASSSPSPQFSTPTPPSSFRNTNHVFSSSRTPSSPAYGHSKSDSLGSLLAAASATTTTQQQLLPSFAAANSANLPTSRPSPSSSSRRFSSSSVTSPTSILSKPSSSLSSSLKTVTHHHQSGPSSPLVLGSSPTSNTPSMGNPNLGPLNTNSPLALAAAASVTPEKLATLLLTQGPLPIRHITSHLTLTIPGFGDLSLSKQRRLIISALDSVDPVNQVRFDKVGWGRWAARKTDSPITASSTLMHSTSSSLQSATSSRRRRESLNPSPAMRPPLSPLLKPADGTSSPASILAAASLKSQSTSVWADDDDAVAAVRGSPGAIAMLAHRRRHRRRSSIHRARMAFKDDVEDDDDDMDDLDDDDDLDLDDYDDDDMAVAGDLELDDEDAERRRKQRKEKRRLKMKRETSPSSSHRRPSETDEEDWQSIGAASLRRSSFVNPTASASSSVPKGVNTPQAHNTSHIAQGFFPLDRHPASSKPTTSSLRNTPLGSFGDKDKSLGGREEEAIEALVQLRSYS